MIYTVHAPTLVDFLVNFSATQYSKLNVQERRGNRRINAKETIQKECQSGSSTYDMEHSMVKNLFCSFVRMFVCWHRAIKFMAETRNTKYKIWVGRCVQVYASSNSSTDTSWK